MPVNVLSRASAEVAAGLATTATRRGICPETVPNRDREAVEVAVGEELVTIVAKRVTCRGTAPTPVKDAVEATEAVTIVVKEATVPVSARNRASVEAVVVERSGSASTAAAQAISPKNAPRSARSFAVTAIPKAISRRSALYQPIGLESSARTADKWDMALDAAQSPRRRKRLAPGVLLPEGMAGRLLRALACKVPGIPALPMLMAVLVDGQLLPGESAAAVTVRSLAF